MGGVVVREEPAVIVVATMLLARDRARDDVKVQVLAMVVGHAGLEALVDHPGLGLDLLLAPLVADNTGNLGRTAVIGAHMATICQPGLAAVASGVVHRKVRTTTSHAAKSTFQSDAYLIRLRIKFPISELIW